MREILETAFGVALGVAIVILVSDWMARGKRWNADRRFRKTGRR